METELIDIKDNVVFKEEKECIVRLSPTFYNNMKAKFNSKALNKLVNK